MPKWAWIAGVVVVIGVVVYLFTRNNNTLPSGNTSSAPAALNPTVATSSYGK
jgi:bacteriorhodopsin